MELRNENVKGVSRRQFLAGAGIGAIGLAGAGLVGCSAKPADTVGAAAGEKVETSWSWEKQPAAIPADEIKSTVDYDVVIIGAGLAGICAAMAAAEKGAKTVIIEKTDLPAARGGHITGFGTKVQREMGIENDYRQVVRRWVEWAQGRVKEPLLWQFAHKSGASMDWVIDKATDKGLKVTMWDGYYKGPDYTEVPVTHFFYEDGTDFLYQNGQVKGAGNGVLVPKLVECAKELGVVIDFETPAVRLVRDGDGPVTAVIAGSEGNYTQYRAAKGVIIATGDYASDKEMVERYDPFALGADSQIYVPYMSNTGDGHKLAMWAGGAMQKVEPHAAVIHLEAGAQSYGFLHVNADGNRFKNEDVNTQSKSCTKEYERDGVAWTVYDAKGLEQVKYQVDNGLGGGLFFGQTFQRMGVEFDLEGEKQILQACIDQKKVVTGTSLDELASKMEIPADAFKKTVARYNEIVASGDDVDFGKRKEILTPIATPPFYAGRLLSTVLTMVGGLRTNPDCAVLDENDKPIPQLYVAGSAAGDFFANDYPTICPGIGHGRCIAFGRLAGTIAAGGRADDIPSMKI